MEKKEELDMVLLTTLFDFILQIILRKLLFCYPLILLQRNEVGSRKWRGSVGGIIDAPIENVWSMVSKSSRLHEWMPMVEKCTDLSGEEGIPGYIRLVSGFMFPQKDGDRSWIKERLVHMDPLSHSYIYQMEASNVGLDGSLNSLKLVDYGGGSTLVNWKFNIDPLEGVSEEYTVDYLGYLYKSCINRIEGALDASCNKASVTFLKPELSSGSDNADTNSVDEM